MQYSHRHMIKYFQQKILDLNDSIEFIHDTLKINPTAEEIGIPTLGKSPMTAVLERSWTKYKNAANVKECQISANEIFDHLSGFFDRVYTYINRATKYCTDMLVSSKKFLEDPKIYLRDFRNYPEHAELFKIIATRYMGTTSINELKIKEHKYSDKIEEFIDTIPTIWKHSLTVDQETQEIHMNKDDYEDMLAIVGTHPIERSKEFSKIRNDFEIDKLATWHFIVDFSEFVETNLKVSDFNKYKLYAKDKLKGVYSKDLKQYSNLFNNYQIKILYKHNIHTNRDFLEAPYSFLKANIPISRSEIVNAKLTLASAVGYTDINKFEIDIMPYSVASYSKADSFLLAISDIKKFFKKDIVRYEDIKDTEDILFMTDDSRCRHICYRIVAFVREFRSKCVVSDGFKFKEIPQNWSFNQHLSAKEKEHAKLDKEDYIQSEVNNNSTQEDPTQPDPKDTTCLVPRTPS